MKVEDKSNLHITTQLPFGWHIFIPVSFINTFLTMYINLALAALLASHLSLAAVVRREIEELDDVATLLDNEPNALPEVEVASNAFEKRLDPAGVYSYHHQYPQHKPARKHKTHKKVSLKDAYGINPATGKAYNRKYNDGWKRQIWPLILYLSTLRSC